MRIIDFKLKDNLVLVEVLQPTQVTEYLNQIAKLALDEDSETSVKQLVVEQIGSEYKIVKVLSVSNQCYNEEKVDSAPLDATIDNYYVVGAGRLSYIGGVTTVLPIALVNASDLLIHLETRDEE